MNTKEKVDFAWSKDKLTPLSLVGSLYVFSSIISPGFIYFFMFHRDFLQHSDWVKLVFLSLGISAPVFLLNIVSISAKDSKPIFVELEDSPNLFFKAAWNTILVFYLTFIIMYFRFVYFKVEMTSSTFFFTLIFCSLFYHFALYGVLQLFKLFLKK